MTSLRLSIAYLKIFYPSNSRYQSIRNYAIKVGESSPISAKNLHKKLSEYRITIEGRVRDGYMLEYREGYPGAQLELAVNSHVIGEEGQSYILEKTSTNGSGYYRISFSPCLYKDIISKGLLKYDVSHEHRNSLDLLIRVKFYGMDNQFDEWEYLSLNYPPDVDGNDFVYKDYDIWIETDS